MEVRLANDGRDLENAVRLIEQLVLASHGIPGGKITIELRKRVVTDGVTDEIDVYVKVDTAPGYESLFLFECKDRKEPADKGDVEILEGKVSRLGAARGFLIARKFATGAEALAKKYPNIQLLTASEAPVSSIFTSLEFSGFHPVDFTSEIRPGGGWTLEATAVFRGKATNLAEVLEILSFEAAGRRVLDEPWPPPGEMREFSCGQTFLMKLGELSVDGQAIASVSEVGRVEFIGLAPSRIIGFDVEARGRVVQVSCRTPDGNEYTLFGAVVPRGR